MDASDYSTKVILVYDYANTLRLNLWLEYGGGHLLLVMCYSSNSLLLNLMAVSILFLLMFTLYGAPQTFYKIG